MRDGRRNNLGGPGECPPRKPEEGPDKDAALAYSNASLVGLYCRRFRETDRGAAGQLFTELKKFLFLSATSNKFLSPPPKLEKIWKMFSSQQVGLYQEYCSQYLGKVINYPDRFFIYNETAAHALAERHGITLDAGIW